MLAGSDPTPYTNVACFKAADDIGGTAGTFSECGHDTTTVFHPAVKVTKDVEVEGTSTGPIVDGYGNGRIGLQLSAVVDRTGFGLEWNTPLPTGEPALSNDVRILTDLQFVKGS